MNQEMRDLLAKASVIAEAPAAGALDAAPGIAHLKPGTVEPRSQGDALFDVMLQRFNQALSEREVAEAIEWAEKALETALRTPAPPKDLLEVGSLAWKRHIAAQIDRLAEPTASLVGDIARINGCSRASAYRYAAMFSERDAA